jgi:hypothetical protein
MRRTCVLLVLAAACGDGKPAPPVAPPISSSEKPLSALPDRVQYDQILIAFRGSYERTETTRTRDEARAVAYSILDRVRTGFDFEVLKQEFSDDRNPEYGIALGPYDTAKDGLPREGKEIPLSNLHKGLAEVVYRLKVGEVSIVDFDERRFPIGWMVVKRLK